MNLNSTNKGALLTTGVLIVFFSAMVTGFILLNAKNKLEYQNQELWIGKYQSAVMDAAQEGEKYRLYAEQAAKQAAAGSLNTFGSHGGLFLESSESDNDGVLLSPECGYYVYNKWSTKTRFCAPANGDQVYERLFDNQLDALMSRYPADVPGNYTYNIVQTGEGFLLQGATNSYVVDISLDESVVSSFSGNLRWPSDTMIVSSCFGNRMLASQGSSGTRIDFHDGIDVPLVEGSSIYSIANGDVLYTCSGRTGNTGSCRDYCGGYGNHVLIRHSLNLYSRYSHLESISVSQGQRVNAGQQIGTSGNTGCSQGPHLDLKIYDTNAEGFAGDTAENPLCLYSQEILDSLQSSAASCRAKHGSPATFDRELQALKEECAKISPETYASLDSDSGNQITAAVIRPGFLSGGELQGLKIGEYYTPANFSVKLNNNLDPSGVTGYYNDILVWAEDVWNNCKEYPESCINDRKTTFNRDPDKTFTIIDRCETTPLYYGIIEAFEDCLNNEQKGCICEFDLMSVYDTNEYEIEFRHDAIEMREPERFTYRPNTDAGLYSQVPSNTPAVGITQIKQEINNGRQITISERGGFNSAKQYNKIRWYKPEKDVLVLTEEIFGAADGKMCNPEVKDTFLVCAQSKQDNQIIKFALQLRNEPPPLVPSSDVEVVTNEEDPDGLASAVQAASLLGPLTPLAGIIMSLIPSSNDASMSVAVDLPEDSDISGFEVHCSIGSPVGNVGIQMAQGVAVVENQYQANNEDGIIGNSLEVDGQALLDEAGAGNLNDPCLENYVLVTDANGNRVYRSKIQVMQDGNKVMFNVNQCGGGLMRQLGSLLSPNYCIKIVPIDSAGQRGQPIEKCEGFSSIFDRVMEQLGLQNIAAPYMKFATDAKDIISSGGSGLVQFVSDQASPFLTNFIDNSFLQGVDTGFMIDSTKRVAQAISDQDYIGLIDDAIKQLPSPEKAGLVLQLITDRSLPPGLEQEIWDNAQNFLNLNEKKQWVTNAVAEFGNLKQGTQDALSDLYKSAAKSLSDATKLNAIKAAISADPTGALAREISRLKQLNLDFNAQAAAAGNTLRVLNELGLTTQQTTALFDRIINGALGLEPQKALMNTITALGDDAFLNSIMSGMSQIQFDNLDDTLRNVLSNELGKLSQQALGSIMESVSSSAAMTSEAASAITDVFNVNSAKDLFNLVNQRYGSQLKSAVTAGLSEIWKPLKCAPNPLDNFQIVSN